MQDVKKILDYLKGTSVYNEFISPPNAKTTTLTPNEYYFLKGIIETVPFQIDGTKHVKISESPHFCVIQELIPFIEELAKEHYLILKVKTFVDVEIEGVFFIKFVDERYAAMDKEELCLSFGLTVAKQAKKEVLIKAHTTLNANLREEEEKSLKSLERIKEELYKKTVENLGEIKRIKTNRLLRLKAPTFNEFEDKIEVISTSNNTLTIVLKPFIVQDINSYEDNCYLCPQMFVNIDLTKFVINVYAANSEYNEKLKALIELLLKENPCLTEGERKKFSSFKFAHPHNYAECPPTGNFCFGKINEQKIYNLWHNCDIAKLIEVISSCLEQANSADENAIFAKEYFLCGSKEEINNFLTLL